MDEISGSIAGAGKAGVTSAARMAKDAMDGAKKMLEGAGSGAGNAVDDATKSIKGLFGK
jgi:hypothetical protein